MMIKNGYKIILMIKYNIKYNYSKMSWVKNLYLIILLVKFFFFMCFKLGKYCLFQVDL